MEAKSITINYTSFQLSELAEDDLALVEAAKKATYTSYAPYSNFSVGAAVRLTNGVIVSGSNQENAAFSAGTCAERCTMFMPMHNIPMRLLQLSQLQHEVLMASLPIVPFRPVAYVVRH